jgi:hypothetical protein
VIEHEQPDGRGQVAMLAPRVDLADEVGQRCPLISRDFLKPIRQ